MERVCAEPQRRRHDWQVAHHLILGIMGAVNMHYLQRIEALALGTQWLVTTTAISLVMLILAGWYARHLVQEAALSVVTIRGVRFRMRTDTLAAHYPVWCDLALSEDVSPADILDTLPAAAERLSTE